MCIIAYVKPNQQITDETIRVMFKGNRDGAGIMYQRSTKDNVRIVKGFMDVESLIKEFRKIPEYYYRAIHCRIATAGKVSVQCCHPFPVRNMADNMMQAKDESPIAYMHNGVISWCNPKDGMKSPYSDTMLFGKHVLYPVRNELDNVGVQNLIEHAINGSRLLVFRKGGVPIMFGNWVTDSNGVHYSNDHYKEYVYTYDGCGAYGYGCSYLGSISKPKAKAKAAPKLELDDIPVECSGDCTHCKAAVCPYLDPTKSSTLCIEVPIDELEDAEVLVEDALYSSNYDIEEWQETSCQDGTVEFYIDVIGFEYFPSNIKSVGGYRVLEVWHN